MSKGFVLILGARSDIGMAIAHRFAQEGYDIQLAARDVKTLESDLVDIQVRYSINVTLHEFDALNLQSHDEFVTSLPQMPLIAVSAVGYIGDQNQSEDDMEAASLVMRSNYEGPASILGILANYFEKRSSGTLIGISSVAGERGRATNYIYGSAKAGFTAFLAGLRNRLYSKGVNVVTVLPGFVDTKMTKDLNLPPALTTNTQSLANRVIIATNKKQKIIYVDRIWFLIMLIIKNIPEFIFVRLKL